MLEAMTGGIKELPELLDYECLSYQRDFFSIKREDVGARMYKDSGHGMSTLNNGLHRQAWHSAVKISMKKIRKE